MTKTPQIDFPPGTKLRYLGGGVNAPILILNKGDEFTVEEWQEYPLVEGWWGFLAKEIGTIFSYWDNTEDLSEEEITSHDFSNRAPVWEKV